MKRTRHQLAPAVPMQKIIDRAVAGCVPDRLLVSRLEIMDVQHLAGARRLRKVSQQGLFLGQGHVLVLASAIRLGLERLDATLVIGHVCAVDRAQRYAHRPPQSRAASFRPRAAAPSECVRAARPGSSIATQSSAAEPRPCCISPSASSESDGQLNHTSRPKNNYMASPPQLTPNFRFKPFWKRYKMPFVVVSSSNSQSLAG